MLTHMKRSTVDEILCELVYHIVLSSLLKRVPKIAGVFVFEFLISAFDLAFAYDSIIHRYGMALAFSLCPSHAYIAPQAMR